MTKVQQLFHLLEQIPPVMQSCGLWQQDSSSQQALVSQAPFAMDTLKPEQWLQWIFLPKMLLLIEEQQPIPNGFLITPYFEECWKLHVEYQPVLALLSLIDEVCA